MRNRALPGAGVHRLRAGRVGQSLSLRLGCLVWLGLEEEIMKASVVVFACVLSAGAFFGCGGSSSSPGGGPLGGGPSGPVQSQDFASVYASTFCSSIAGCCTSTGYPADTASCNSTLRPTVDALTKVYATKPKIMYDA